jgi:hypothetical protein
LKDAREKCQVTLKGKLIRITDLSTETLKAKKAWNYIFSAMKENNCQLELLCPEKLSFINEEEINIFHDK